jgi:phage recombination protein Bet
MMNEQTRNDMSERPPEQDKTLTVGKPKALAVMANRLNVEPQKLLQTLKDTVFKGANDSELLTLVVVANEYGLSPLLKEIYAFPAKGGGIVPVVSIDGWISMVNRQPQLDGLEFEWAGGELPESCTCTIYIKNRQHPVRITEFYKECVRSTEPWKQMPRRMLRHKALKEAARVAFGFSGVTDEDEARDMIKNADARVVEPRSFPPPRKVDPPVFAGAQSDVTELEPTPAATAPKPQGKGKTADKETKPEESVYQRLYAVVREYTTPEDFMAGLKLIAFPGIQSDAELLSELGDELCEEIIPKVGELMDKIRDRRWIEGVK